ncbi:3-deoxy-7-phosphoheptulonate synthase [Pelobacter propionicus]|uniref:3-deoxy-D-arabinoheptulosonate-7-phosphate synthase n=1 Tax=Pelobacter propionicus (strain DSM 2379 / NBRC 103807 / OttBd1) TaxID=338966 RepID=A1APD0_PELPD|nr:3-deoxy-7-phosphoheptulonate synthase [Pelobacter propionicus]ABK99200.1 3-deoxy-D-arabinoheptulosonate-7-phosphate synthase [Pelobacter propionicus DSM 2379]
MIIVMKAGATKKERDEVLKRIRELGYKPHVIHGSTRDVIGAIGDERGKAVLQKVESMHGVENVLPILQPYKLASKELKKEASLVRVNDQVCIGGQQLIVMAGPCSVESEEQIIESAIAVKAAGAQMLRGGAFKPRTSPYSFQGMEEEGLKLLAKAREVTGLPFVTEVINPETAELVAEYSDMLQIGARNAQNFALLKKVGQLKRPVLLKRGMSMTIQEFLMSAEYIMSEGNQSVILCERGIRTFETATRNTLDLSAIPVLKGKTHLPVVIDPSHGTGNHHYVAPMCYAAVAAGADGLMVEVHPDPENASSDGAQSLKPVKFAAMMEKLKLFAAAAGRTL